MTENFQGVPTLDILYRLQGLEKPYLTTRNEVTLWESAAHAVKQYNRFASGSRRADFLTTLQGRLGDKAHWLGEINNLASLLELEPSKLVSKMDSKEHVVERTRAEQARDAIRSEGVALFEVLSDRMVSSDAWLAAMVGFDFKYTNPAVNAVGARWFETATELVRLGKERASRLFQASKDLSAGLQLIPGATPDAESQFVKDAWVLQRSIEAEL